VSQAAAQPTKVLLVDDDDVFRRSTARILAGHGYSCVERATGAEARTVLDTQHDVAALLCDIRMPGTSGLELLRELAADFPDLAVVMTTGIDDPQLAEVAFELGAFGYVIKPFDTNELLISLASALRRRDLESQQRRHVRALEQTIAHNRILDREPGTSPTANEDEDASRISVLIVDDHEIFAHSLVRLLGSKPELKVVGTAGSVSTAVVAAVAYQPDVILMDFELPDGDGPDATQQIKALTPAVKVVMLTAHTVDHALVRALSAGCSGFVRKTEAVDELLDAIVAAHQGEIMTPPADLAPLLAQLRPTSRGLGAAITPRELEVLGLVAAGLGNKQIAERLGLSLNTVRNHTQSLLQKLQAHSKLEAVATAVREGIIDYPRVAED
jgi:DNA-binding NarL/FixJ family response regulator